MKTPPTTFISEPLQQMDTWNKNHLGASDFKDRVAQFCAIPFTSEIITEVTPTTNRKAEGNNILIRYEC